jgi:hypothetical protein
MVTETYLWARGRDPGVGTTSSGSICSITSNLDFRRARDVGRGQDSIVAVVVIALFLVLFAGKCGHASPCEQLCYELHDGMYECDCTEGYELNRNGYSCEGKGENQRKEQTSRRRE